MASRYKVVNEDHVGGQEEQLVLPSEWMGKPSVRNSTTLPNCPLYKVTAQSQRSRNAMDWIGSFVCLFLFEQHVFHRHKQCQVSSEIKCDFFLWPRTVQPETRKNKQGGSKQASKAGLVENFGDSGAGGVEDWKTDVVKQLPPKNYL